MKPARFAYFAPPTLADAIGLLAEHGERAKILAGGQSLVPLMNLRLVRPEVLVDLNRVTELAYVEPRGGVLRIGAMTRHDTVATSEAIIASAPLLSHAAGLIGYRSIRYRGTMGGSMAHADSASELPCVAVTQGAEIEMTGSGGERSMPAGDFFVDHMTTALQSDEVISAVRFSEIQSDETWGFQEFAPKAGDFAVAMAAAVVRTVDGEIASAKIGIGGAETRPRRVAEAELALEGASLASPEVAAAAGEAAAEAVDPVSDIHGSTDFRRQLVRTLVRRTLHDAASRMEVAGG